MKRLSVKQLVCLAAAMSVSACASREEARFRGDWSEAKAQAVEADGRVQEVSGLLSEENYEIACARLVDAERSYRGVVQRLTALREALAKSGLDETMRESFEMVDSDVEQSQAKAGEVDAMWKDLCGADASYQPPA